jgi:hypothetical protein
MDWPEPVDAEGSPNWRSRPGAYEMGCGWKAKKTTKTFGNNMLRNQYSKFIIH